MEKRLLQIKDKISVDLHRGWKITEMARIVNLSAATLTNLFKTQTGMSPAEYLRHLRLEAARKLLADSFERIKTIRLQVGMPDASHFSREFKKKYGVSPSAYRKKIWAGDETDRRRGGDRRQITDRRRKTDS